KPSFGYSSLQSNSHHRNSHSRVTAAAVASATCTVFVLLIVGFVLKSWKSCSKSPKSTSNRAKTFPANMEAGKIGSLNYLAFSITFHAFVVEPDFYLFYTITNLLPKL